MNSSLPWLPVTVSGLFAQLPLIAVSLLGVILCLARWHDAPAASRWTLAASLLSLFVCVASPIAQGFIMESMRTGGTMGATLKIFWNGMFRATLRAISIGFLLLAIYSGRTAASGVRVFPPPAGSPLSPNL